MSADSRNSAERESVWGAMDAGAADAIALSAAGAARRERMIGDVRRAAGAKRARRVAVRGVGVMMLAGVVTVGIWMALPRDAGKAGAGGEVVMTGPGTREETGRTGNEAHGGHESLAAGPRGPHQERGTSPTGPEEEAEGRGIRVEVVKHDPGIMARYAAGREGERVAEIDDVELMRLMEEMGKPTGIVKTNGKVMLTAEMERREGKPLSAGREGDGVGRG